MMIENMLRPPPEVFKAHDKTASGLILMFDAIHSASNDPIQSFKLINNLFISFIHSIKLLFVFV